MLAGWTRFVSMAGPIGRTSGTRRGSHCTARRVRLKNHYAKLKHKKKMRTGLPRTTGVCAPDCTYYCNGRNERRLGFAIDICMPSRSDMSHVKRNHDIHVLFISSRVLRKNCLVFSRFLRFFLFPRVKKLFHHFEVK